VSAENEPHPVASTGGIRPWDFAPDGGSEPIPAATVVLARDADDGLEVLMLRRNSRLAFGAMWVSPGGRIDPADRIGAADDEGAARRAAVREAWEEAGLVVVEHELVFFAHWLPPATSPRRFATWFFVAPAPDDHAVTIDDGEIHEAEWMSPAAALARRDAGEIEVAPPTFRTLHDLASHGRVDELMAEMRGREPEFFRTRIVKGAAGTAALWHGDAGYDAGDLELPGPRHRLWIGGGTWSVERRS
jgi:8-oxo-dGTP pyrophosphatase MutT (NUDIX family)